MSDLLIASAGDLIFAAGLADFRLGFLSILGHLEWRDLMVSVLGEILVTTEPRTGLCGRYNVCWVSARWPLSG